MPETTHVRGGGVAIAAAATLTGGLVLGVALVSAPEPTAEPDRFTTAPSPAARSGPSAATAGAGRESDPQAVPEPDSLDGTEDWRNALFRTARSVLDPEGRHLDYSTRSLQSGGDGQGGVHLGIKMGWRVPGQPGEGLVEVVISDERGFGSGCASVVGESCRERRTLDGVEYHVLHTGGGFVLRHRQEDGEVVLVHVDRLFGNTATVAVDSTVSEREALRLARDERLDLP